MVTYLTNQINYSYFSINEITPDKTKTNTIEPHNGDRTTHHDQSTWFVTFNTIKIRVINPIKLILGGFILI